MEHASTMLVLSDSVACWDLMLNPSRQRRQRKLASPRGVVAPAAADSAGAALAPRAAVSGGANWQAVASLLSEVPEAGPVRRRWYRRGLPAWLVSLLVHMTVIVLLAAVSLDPTGRGERFLTLNPTTSVDEGDLLESFELLGVDSLPEAPPGEDPPTELPALADVVSDPSPLPLEAVVDPSDVQAGQLDMLQSLAPIELAAAGGGVSVQMLSARSGADRKSMLEKYGGTADTEKAVARALRWLAAHQAPDGGWNFNHQLVNPLGGGNPGDMVQARNGATAIALLPFLGAGQTHLQGEYQTTVFAGLNFLINQMKIQNLGLMTGSWHEPGGRMYSHGLASIAICEAYAMTKDPDLAKPAQLALNFIAYAQDPARGGWRYEPRRDSDTSVAGWQIMALKSGSMGGLKVSLDSLRRADAFLNSVQANDGALYGYQGPEAEPSRAMVAAGLLCRMYMGWPREHPGLTEGVDLLARAGPHPSNMYYNYYATQVLIHYGGPQWDAWNQVMREQLVREQVASGPATGSWYFAQPALHSRTGGRLYCTAMAAMILEVYYRYLPLYGDVDDNDDFKL
jgi:hypothetical protein